jgi:hypothetical protein
MAMMAADLYAALKEAGASDEAARKAATEVAGFDRELAAVGGDLGPLKLATGLNSAMLVALVVRAFF